MDSRSAPPARLTDCIGDTPLEDIGPSGDRTTDRCCRPPPQSIGGGAASSAVRQQGGQHACLSLLSRCCLQPRLTITDRVKENGMASEDRSRFTLFLSFLFVLLKDSASLWITNALA